MNRGSWEKVYSKTLPSSDSGSQTSPRLPSHNHSQYSCFFLSPSLLFNCVTTPPCLPLSLSLCLSLFLSLPILFQCQWRLHCGSSGGAESNRKKHGKRAIWMKLPLILQLLVQSHILFCSVVVGSEHYFGALSNLTDVTVLLHCCLSKNKTLERNLDSLFSAFMKT